MRKLFLASYKFKTGDREFEEQNLIALDTESDDPEVGPMFLKWFKEIYPNSEFIDYTIRTTIDLTDKQGRYTVLAHARKHTLQECFGELKFGRPAESQKQLERFIKSLNRFNDENLTDADIIVGELLLLAEFLDVEARTLIDKLIGAIPSDLTTEKG